MEELKRKHDMRQVFQNNSFLVKQIFKASPLRIPAVMFCSLAERAQGILFGIITLGFVLNAVEKKTDTLQIFIFVGILSVAAFILYIAVSLCTTLYFPHSDLKIHQFLMKQTFEKAQEVDLDCYENPEFYEKYIKAVNTIKERASLLLDTISQSSGSLFAFLSLSGIILSIDKLVAPIIVTQFFINLIFTKRANREKHVYMMKVSEHDRQSDYVKRVFYLPEYAKELRCTNISSVLLDRFYGAVDKALKDIKKHGLKCMLYRLIVDGTSGNIGNFLVILFVAYRIIVTKSMLLGDGLIAVSSLRQITDSLQTQESTLFAFHEHSLYIENLRHFFEYKPKMNKTGKYAMPSDRRLDIKVDNVSFYYFGSNKKALDNVTIEIKEGQKAAIVGSNGAGKSTLVKLLLRLYDPNTGSIKLGENSISDFDVKEYRDLYSTVFQDFKLFSLSVSENILMRREGDEKLVIDSLRESGMLDYVKTLKNGINTVLTREFDEDGIQLSGGMNQKIALSRLFAQNSKIAILDEPSSALDPVAEHELFENMLRICRDKTVIFISHRLSSVISADIIYMMEDGRIIEKGSHAELMTQNGKYADMFRKQAQNYA